MQLKLRWFAGTLITAALLTTLTTGAEPGEPLKIGLITEPTASHISGYLEVLAVREGVESVALAVDDEKTQTTAKTALGSRYHADGFRNSAEMLSQYKPDLTIVTAEGRHSPEFIRAALEAGSHVIAEKPACTRIEQFRELAELADSRERHLMLAMATRSGASFKKARQLIADGMIGEPYSASMVWIADQTRLTKPSYHQSWMADPARSGGGKLIYHGIHYLDVIQHLLDESISEVSCFTENVGGQPIGVEDAAVVTFRFPSGVIGTHNTGYYLPARKQSEIWIWGSLGWIRFEHLEDRPLQWMSTKPGAPEGLQVFEEPDSHLMYHLFFQDAIDAIREDAAPPISTKESLRALEVVFAAYRSAESGQAQRLPSTDSP